MFLDCDGVQFWGSKDFNCLSPMEGQMLRVFLIKNTSNEHKKVVFNDVSQSGSIMNYYGELGYTTHPNAWDGELDPGAEAIFLYDISNYDFNGQEEDASFDSTFTQNGRVDNDFTQGSNFSLVFSFNVDYIGCVRRDEPESRTATIKGVVTDKQGQPISDCQISIDNMINGIDKETKTDENGEFSITVTPYKWMINGQWHETMVVFEAKGFDERAICVYPKDNTTNEVSIVLYEKTESVKYSYDESKIIDLGIQAYDYDANIEKDIAAFVPFHSGLQLETIIDKLYMTVVNTKGDVMFRYKLNDETPYVDISDDGEYLVVMQATGRGRNGAAITRVVILDREGNEVYSRDKLDTLDNQKIRDIQMIDSDSIEFGSRCGELSHNNKYLMVATENIWLIDWQNDKELWCKHTCGQVREIKFTEDDKYVIVSSGDAFMYCFDMEGNLIWKTFTGSWATDMEIVDDKLVYTLKTSRGSLGCIDIKTGEIKWIYETMARGSGIAVSPDHTMLWYGNDISGSYSCMHSVVFDIETGEAKFMLPERYGQAASWSLDGKYLVVKSPTTLSVYNGYTGARLWSRKIITSDGGNAQSNNSSLVVNEDASVIIAAFNNDSSERVYGQAYIFTRK